MEAFKKMETMEIRPDDTTYNQLMLVYAKKKDIDMVEKLNKEAVTKYGLLPSVQRYNALIMVHAKANKA